MFKSNEKTLLFTFLLIFISSIIVIFTFSSIQAEKEASKDLERILEQHKALHLYVENIQKPVIYELKEKGLLYEEFFDPKLLSFTYISRNIHELYQQNKLDKNEEPYKYKLASTNPRNPVNLATPFEKEILEKFQTKQIKEFHTIIDSGDKKYFYKAFPVTENKQSCMKCHSVPEVAPKEMVQMYGPDNGFGEKVGDIRAMISLTIPMTEIYNKTIQESIISIGIIFLILLSLYILLYRNIKQKQLLNIQKEEFEKIFQYAQDGISIIDLESNFLDFNEAYLKMTGFTREELLQKSCIGLTAPEDKEESQKILEQLLKTGYVESFQKACIVKNGKRLYANMTASVLPDKKRILLITKDVTSQKIAQEQLRLASLGEMIGNIAHQWRQPLSVITTSASGLKLKVEVEEKVDNNEVLKYSDLIVQQAEYLSSTIDNFRKFIKGEKHQTKTDIVEAVKNALDLEEATLKNNYIEVVKDIDADVNILGCINELTEAFINIINNSIDILKEKVDKNEKRLIFITTKQTSESLFEVCIKDNGGGISNDIIERVFDPYFTTKHQALGTGLGLSIVNKIIQEHHHGTIHVYNEEYEYESKKYKGACFKISFDIRQRLA